MGSRFHLHAHRKAFLPTRIDPKRTEKLPTDGIIDEKMVSIKLTTTKTAALTSLLRDMSKTDSTPSTSLFELTETINPIFEESILKAEKKLEMTEVQLLTEALLFNNNQNKELTKNLLKTKMKVYLKAGLSEEKSYALARKESSLYKETQLKAKAILKRAESGNKKDQKTIKQLESFLIQKSKEAKHNAQMRDIDLKKIEESLGFNIFQNDLEQFKAEFFEQCKLAKIPVEAQKEKLNSIQEMRDLLKLNLRRIAKHFLDTSKPITKEAIIEFILNTLNKNGKTIQTLVTEFSRKNHLILSKLSTQPFREFLHHLKEEDKAEVEKKYTAKKQMGRFFTGKKIKGYKRIETSKLTALLQHAVKKQAKLSSTSPIRKVTQKLSITLTEVDSSKSKSIKRFSQLKLLNKALNNAWQIKTKDTSIDSASSAIQVGLLSIKNEHIETVQNTKSGKVIGTLKSIGKLGLKGLKKIIKFAAGVVTTPVKSLINIAKNLALPLRILANRFQRNILKSDVPKLKFDILQWAKELANDTWTVASAALILGSFAAGPLGAIVAISGVTFLSATVLLASKNKASATKLNYQAKKQEKQQSIQIEKLRQLSQRIGLDIRDLKKDVSKLDATDTESKERLKAKIEQSKQEALNAIKIELSVGFQQAKKVLSQRSEATLKNTEALLNVLEFINWSITIAAAGSLADGTFKDISHTIRENIAALQPAIDNISEASGRIALDARMATNDAVQHSLFYTQDQMMKTLGERALDKSATSREAKLASTSALRASRQRGVQLRLQQAAIGAKLMSQINQLNKLESDLS